MQSESGHRSPTPPHQRGGIDPQDAEDIRFWTQRWAVTEAELRLAIQRVGNAIDEVARVLGKQI